MRKYIATSMSYLALLTPVSAPAAAVSVAQTGQDTCYSAEGVIIDCTDTGQDGAIRAGAPIPSPRFTDNKNGTVTDNMTGLIWLKDADCTDTVGGISRRDGTLDWQSALTWCNNLGHGNCNLADKSVAGDWRLPNINELRSLIDYSRHDPALADGHPFAHVRMIWYWSSTTNPVYTFGAYNVGLSRGSIHVNRKLYSAPGSSRMGNKVTDSLGVWPVRGGQQKTLPPRR